MAEPFDPFVDTAERLVAAGGAFGRQRPCPLDIILRLWL